MKKAIEDAPIRAVCKEQYINRWTGLPQGDPVPANPPPVAATITDEAPQEEE